MNTTFKYALSIASIAIILKLGIFFGGYNFQWPDDYYLYAAFLFTLVGVFMGMRSIISQTKGSLTLMDLIKGGCKIASLNSLLMAGFLYVYYKFIDAGYFQNKINDTMALMDKSGASIEEMMKYYMNAKYLFFAPNTVFSFALFGYLFLGCTYAVLSGFLLRRNLRRG